MNHLLSRTIILKVSLLMLFSLLTTDGFCQSDTPLVKLSRQQAIAMAISHNIDLRVRALDSSLSETNIQASKSIYNPFLTGTLDYSRTSAAGENYGTETTSTYVGLSQRLSTGATVTLSTQTGPTSAVSDPLYDYTDWSTSVGINVYQPLLKNAGKQATELGITLDKQAYAASVEAFRGEVIDTVFAVISDYNRLYVLRQLLESREAAVQSAQQLQEEIKTRPNPGDNPDVELANTAYALSQRQTEMIEAERQVSSKEASLRYLIGMEQTAHILPLDPPSRIEPIETEQEAIALAIDQHPDLKELRIQLESNQISESVSKRNLLPDLAVTANAGYRGYAQDGGFGDTLSQIGSGKGDYWSAGLRLNFPLGNDLAKSNYRRNALRSEQLKNQLAAAEWKIRDTIQEDNRSLLSARLQVRATAKSKQLAEQRVAQYQKNRRRGAASVKDLLDAENDLIYARNLELNAIENFSYLVTRLWKDIGVLLERQNIRIDNGSPEQVTSGGSDLPLVPTGKTTEEPEPDQNSTAQEAASASKPVTVKPVAAIPVAAEPASTGKTANLKRSTFTLELGEFFSSELPEAKKKIARTGLVPVVLEGPGKARDVIRLHIGEYQTLAAAQEALKQLKDTHSGGFILKHEARRYDAYAGSFFTRKDAETEQRRLAARGIQLTLRDVSVVLPNFILTAGSFPTREAALAKLKQLKEQGLDGEVLQNQTP
jgi:outer membrane protein